MIVMAIEVELLNHMGNDYTPVQQARLSYGKQVTTDDKDTQLLERLLKDKHLVPLEHIVMTFKIYIPIFVQRQLVKYRVSSWSEKSNRYTKHDSDFYLPSILEDNENITEIMQECNKIYDMISISYNKLLEMGVNKEDQRMVLPVSSYTSVLWTMNMREFMHIADQRITTHQQKETRQTVEMMLEKVSEVYPKIISIYLKLKGE